jgi:5-methylcytosine-specific restriction endonuclease McrA
MFKDNKYTKLYFIITDRARDRVLETYTERHHIIPQSLGGSDDRDNLVDLTGKEHFICHWLLIKMTEGEQRNKMLYALQGMKAENKYQQRYSSSITARVYEKYRIEHAKNHSIVMKSKNLIPWNKGGVEITNEHRENLKKAAKHRKIDPIKQAEGQAKRVAKIFGQKRSEDTRIKMSLASKGKSKGPMSEEEKLKRSIAQKGKAKPEGFGDKVAVRMKEEFSKNNPNNREDLKKTCPHCHKTFGPSNYARWHGSNCRHRS